MSGQDRIMSSQPVIVFELEAELFVPVSIAIQIIVIDYCVGNQEY